MCSSSSSSAAAADPERAAAAADAAAAPARIAGDDSAATTDAAHDGSGRVSTDGKASGGVVPADEAGLAADKVTEVRSMAADVLQRKQSQDRPSQNGGISDPLLLLMTPEKSVKARKQQLMSSLAADTKSSAEEAAVMGSNRVAAAKSEVSGAGVARMREAWSMRVSASEEGHQDRYQPPLLKRPSREPLTPAPSNDSVSSTTAANKNTTGGNTIAITCSSASFAPGASGATLGSRAAVVLKKQGGTSVEAGASAAVPSGAAARAMAAGGPVGGTGDDVAANPFVLADTSNEVAAMAALVLNRRNNSSAGC